MSPISLVTVRLRRRTPILVCRKCMKRAPAGSDLKRALKAALKRGRSDEPERKPRMVMTSCFGICPKRALVVASGATLARGECLLLANAADVEEAVAKLLSESAGQTRTPTPNPKARASSPVAPPQRGGE